MLLDVMKSILGMGVTALGILWLCVVWVWDRPIRAVIPWIAAFIGLCMIVAATVAIREYVSHREDP